MSLIRKALNRLHYPVAIIAQCVRWYLAYSLSLRDLEEMMAERGISVDHTTLYRRVIRLTPLLGKVFRRHKRAAGLRWRMDETYIKIKGQWKYLYRALDSAGQIVDFLLTAWRDQAAALRFFKKAFRQHGEPEVVTIDKSGANTAALTAINAPKSKDKAIVIRQNKYLNNLVEQDHRNIKYRIRPMLGFKSFRRAQTILAGAGRALLFVEPRERRLLNNIERSLRTTITPIELPKMRLGIGADPRIGYHFIYPGCGYGGSCFPKDIQALISTAEDVGYPTPLLRAVEQVNQRQKQKLFAKIIEHFGPQLEGRTFAIWGISFKPNTNDVRAAPSLTLMEALWQAGASVRAFDPQAIEEVRHLYGARVDFQLVESKEEALYGADGLVICTE